MPPFRALVVLAFGLAAPLPALAQGQCAALEELKSRAEVSDPDMARAAELAGAFAGHVPVTCQIARIHAAADQLICTWPFAYGDVAAPDLLERLAASLLYCTPDAVRLPADLPVNHPDFYKLHQFDMPLVSVAVSLKDKGALGQRFVRLRLSSRE